MLKKIISQGQSSIHLMFDEPEEEEQCGEICPDQQPEHPVPPAVPGQPARHQRTHRRPHRPRPVYYGSHSGQGAAGALAENMYLYKERF